jgi:hypothetical protein
MVTIETPEFLETHNPELEETERQHLTRQYALSCVAELLLKETKTTDIVSFVDGRFVLMLPETQREEATRLVDRLKKRMREILAADLQTGLSSFPNEEITIFGLMQQSAPKRPPTAGNPLDVLPPQMEAPALESVVEVA